jgi:hypothetical protein
MIQYVVISETTTHIPIKSRAPNSHKYNKAKLPLGFINYYAVKSSGSVTPRRLNLYIRQTRVVSCSRHNHWMGLEAH